MAIAALALLAAFAVPRIAPRNADFDIENRTDQEIQVHVGKDPQHSAFAIVGPQGRSSVMVSAPPRDGEPSADWAGGKLPVSVGAQTVLIPAEWNPWHTYTFVWCGTAGCH